MIIIETEWSCWKVDLNTILWRQKCCCNPAATNGTSVRSIMGSGQHGCKIYQSCNWISKTIL